MARSLANWLGGALLGLLVLLCACQAPHGPPAVASTAGHAHALPPPIAPGAHESWVTYEAEDLARSGGATLIMPPAPAAGWDEALDSRLAIEASGRQCVRLPDAAAALTWTAQAPANAIVVRYSLPDAPTGGGLDAQLALCINGAQVAVLPLTSRYSWRYGAYPFTNQPADGRPKNLYDEVRLAGLSVRAGATLQVHLILSAAPVSCVIDLVDLEQVPPPLSPPPGALAVTEFDADASGVVDATAKFQAAIQAAREQHRTLWLPPGRYLISGELRGLHDLTIQGAGMWYSTLVGDPTRYNRDAAARLRLTASGGHLHLADFAITGCLDYRNDREPNDGVAGDLGAGSSITRLWIEHTKAGIWATNASDLLISGCRFRNTIADGVNLCAGVEESVVVDCTARGTGDDGFAIWPAAFAQSTGRHPGHNRILACNASLTTLGNGLAIYGGDSNALLDCAVRDIPYGCGILIAGTFPIGPNAFSGTTLVRHCLVTRAGGFEVGWHGWRGAVAICPEKNPIRGLELRDLCITDSLSSALVVTNPGGTQVLEEALLDGVTITGYGVAVRTPTPIVGGIWASRESRGSLAIRHLTIDGAAVTSPPATGTAVHNDSPAFAFTFLAE